VLQLWRAQVGRRSFFTMLKSATRLDRVDVVHLKKLLEPFFPKSGSSPFSKRVAECSESEPRSKELIVTLACPDKCFAVS
jgi:hypothetical protein